MRLRLVSVGLLLASAGCCVRAQSPRRTRIRAPHKSPPPATLSERERAVQLLDRFTFGARPGDVERVLAQGEDQWLTQQMSPETVNDAACDKRLQQYPTLTMTPAQALSIFPDRQQVYAVADGKEPYPADPLMKAVYEVQVAKWNAERDGKKADGTGQPRPEPTEAEKAAKKQQDQATAARLFGELIAMPKKDRVNAIVAMPVDDRIALTGNGNLAGDQRNLLFNDFSPREREMFQAMSGNVSASGNIGNELAQARILRDILSERQVLEVMTDFWFNHFNVFIGKDSDQWYTTSYERDAIRKHALGPFRDLLLATAQSPAMMVYLDNWLSIGPDSLANGVNPQKPNSKRGNKGLNENYGREVMELHTVGVNGGYTQADVTALSAILTGWGVDQPQKGGGFSFDAKRHEPGPKSWFGYEIDEQGNAAKLDGAMPAGKTFGPSDVPADARSVKQGITALRILASAPQTAHFISYLLAQRFVADDPPETLVDRLAKVYVESDGDIKTILRALIASPEFNSKQYFRNKVKTPVEFVASAFRATGTDPQNPGALVNTLKQMGMELYHALPPTGYYLTADHWMNSVALVDRLNFAYQLTSNHYANQKFDAPRLLATGMMLPGVKDTTRPEPARGHALPVSSERLEGDLPIGSAGRETALHLLEATIVNGPVSAKTNELIEAQMGKQPANSSATDTLNVLTALVLGAPEFQTR